jgi:hypothetical protein
MKIGASVGSCGFGVTIGSVGTVGQVEVDEFTSEDYASLPQAIANFTGPSDGIGWNGPFISSAGNVYVIGIEGTNVVYYKATDPTSSFAAGVTMFGHTSSMASVHAHQVGDTLYVVGAGLTTGPAAQVSGRSLDMSTDTLEASSHAHGTTTPINYGCAVARRSNGDLISFHNIAGVTNMGKTYGRVAARRRSSGSWGATTDIGFGSTATTQQSESVDSALLASSDRVHLFWTRGATVQGASNSSFIMGRCVKSTDNLGGTAPATAAYTVSSQALYLVASLDDVQHSSGQAFLSSGNQICVPFYRFQVGGFHNSSVAVASDADTPTWTVTNVGGSPKQQTIGNTDQVGPMGGAPYDGTNKSFVYVDSFSEPYWSQDTGSGWVGVKRVLQDVTSTLASANVYTRSGNVYLGMVYDVGTSQWVYDEVYLRAGAGPTTVTPGRVAATASVPSVTISIPQTVTPAKVSVTASVPAVTIAIGVAAAPATVSATATVRTVTISATGSVPPATVAATATVQTVTPVAVSIATPNVVAATASVPSVTVVTGGNQDVPVSPVAATATVQAVTVQTAGNTDVLVSTVVATATVRTVTPSIPTSFLVQPVRPYAKPSSTNYRTFSRAAADRINFNIDNSAITGPFTIAVICRAATEDALSGNQGILRLGPGTANRYQFSRNGADNFLRLQTNGTNHVGTTAILAAHGWVLLVISKASGTVQPRGHIYRYDTGVWVHENLSNTKADSVVDAGNSAISSGQFWDGDVYTGAAWASDMSDGQVEALAAVSEQWGTLGAYVVIKLDQPSTTIGPPYSIATDGTTVNTQTNPPWITSGLPSVFVLTTANVPTTTVAATAAVPAVTIDVGGATDVPVSTVTATTSIPSVTINTTAVVTTGTPVAATATVRAVTINTTAVIVAGTPVVATATVRNVTINFSGAAIPNVVAATATVRAVTINTTALVTAGTPVAATASVPSVVVQAGAGTTVTPLAVTATASVRTITISATATVAPGPVAATATVRVASAAPAALAQPSTVAAIATVQPVNISAVPTIQPNRVAATATVPAITISTTALVLGGTPVVATGTVPTVSITVPALAAPPKVSATATVPSVTVLAAVTPAPNVVAAVATVRTVTINLTGAAIVAPASAIATVQAVAIQAGGGATVTPGRVPATATVQPVTISTTAVPAPNLVQATATVRPVTINTTAIIVGTPAAAVATVQQVTVQAGAGETVAVSRVQSLATVQAVTITAIPSVATINVAALATVPSIVIHATGLAVMTPVVAVGTVQPVVALVVVNATVVVGPVQATAVVRAVVVITVDDAIPLVAFGGPISVRILNSGDTDIAFVQSGVQARLMQSHILTEMRT